MESDRFQGIWESDTIKIYREFLKNSTIEYEINEKGDIKPIPSKKIELINIIWVYYIKLIMNKNENLFIFKCLNDSLNIDDDFSYDMKVDININKDTLTITGSEYKVLPIREYKFVLKENNILLCTTNILDTNGILLKKMDF